jgi:GT2 family glycosyltransferase
MTGIDVVVVNYKTPEDLESFLCSWVRYPPTGPHNLTVVNVSPAQEDEAIIPAWRHTLGFRYHCWSDNVGYARACNHGASEGTGDIIAFFNADVRLTEHALDECAQALRDNPTWGVLGPRQVDDHNKITHAGIFGTNTAPAHRAWQNHDHPNLYGDIREAVTVSGSAYFIKRALWEELTVCPKYREVAPFHSEGAFLPTQHYFEETWCSYHARAHGWHVMYYGPVKIVHRWHKASPVGGWAEKQFPASQQLFRMACQHHGIAHD